jgi:hypothetical protein
LSFIFVLAAFLARLLRIEDKRALLSLFLEVLGSGIDGKVAYGKDVGSGGVGSEKVSGSLADFALSLLLLSTTSYKERFGIYFLKLN